MPYLHETTPDKEAEIARQALTAGDFANAAYHIGTALQFDPQKPEWRALLDEVLRTVPDQAKILRLNEKKADFITVATRAYAYAAQGNLTAALPLLADAAAMRPDVAFLTWGAEWLKQPGATGALGLELVCKQLIPPILSFVTNCPASMAKEDDRWANVMAAAEILNAAREKHPQESFVLFACSVVARRLGYFDWAIHFAGQAYQLKNDWNTTVGVACAYRDAGKVDEAVQWFKHALSQKPDEVSAWLDIGDTYLKAARWDEAIAAYGEALKKDPDDGWAVPSVVFARFKKTGAPAEKATLLAMCQQPQVMGRAWALWCELEPPQLYINRLPPPADATANGLRNVINQLTENPGQADGGKLELKVTHPESPSVLVAFRLWAERAKARIAVNVVVEKVQTPDPRAPKGPVDFAVWAYDGTTPRPNLGTPDPRAAEAIAAIAKEPYHLGLWDGPALKTAQMMGVAWLQHIVATMVNPPPLPPDFDPMLWVQRVQIAAALVIGRMETTWEGSQRKRALTSLALGPVDWTVDAALCVMAFLAKDDPAIRADAAAIYAQLEKQIPETGYTCFEYPLVCSWLALAGLDPATTKRLSAWKEQIEARDRAAPDADQEEEEEQAEKHGGLTLEQYAELSVRRDAILAKHGGGVLKAGMAMAGQGAYPELEKLCKEFGLDPKLVSGQKSAAAGRIPEWDQRINQDRRVQEMFFAMQNDARLKMQGIDFNSHEGRVAEQIRSNTFDVEGATVGAQAAAQKMAAGDAGDPDPVVFPGQKIAKLSDYVKLMKGMQTGDMMGALAKCGLDMGSYMTVAQAWGIKMAADPTLTAKFSKMMAS